MADLTTIIASARGLWKVLAKAPLLTRWLLRRNYPDGKCRELMILDLMGNQARFELSANRPSAALSNLGLAFHNHLPFDVTIDLYQLSVVVESHVLMNEVLNQQIVIPASASGHSWLPELTLTDQQANWVRDRQRACTNVQVELHWRSSSSIQHWEDRRSFLFLASINN